MPPKPTQYPGTVQSEPTLRRDSDTSRYSLTRPPPLAGLHRSRSRSTHAGRQDTQAAATEVRSNAGTALLPATAPPVRTWPAGWSDLPLELQLDVLERLSATELLTYIVPGHPFKHLIEAKEESIEATLIRRRKCELLAEIRAFDYHELSLFDALRHWVKYKAIPMVDSPRWYSGRGFAIRFTASQGRNIRDSEQMWVYVDTLLELHACLYGDAAVRPGRERDELLSILRPIQLPAWFKASHDDIENVINGRLGSPLIEDFRARRRARMPFETRTLMSTNPNNPHEDALFTNEQDFVSMFDLDLPADRRSDIDVIRHSRRVQLLSTLSGSRDGIQRPLREWHVH